jgi:hypothetical protein
VCIQCAITLHAVLPPCDSEEYRYLSDSNSTATRVTRVRQQYGSSTVVGSLAATYLHTMFTSALRIGVTRTNQTQKIPQCDGCAVVQGGHGAGVAGCGVLLSHGLRWG